MYLYSPCCIDHYIHPLYLSLAIMSSPATASMENSLRSVALLNFKGLHALVMGRKKHVPRAVSAFQEALVLLGEVQRQQQQCDTMDESRPRMCCLEAFNSSPIDRLEAQMSSSFFVYNRAVFFNPVSDTSAIGITFYTAILQFNMALAYHIKLVSTSTTISSHGHKRAIKVAVQFYKQCLKTLKQVGVGGKRPPHPGGGEAMIYLRLAALNNLAHVQFVAGNFDMVHVTLGRIFKFSLDQRPTLFQTQPMEDCSSRRNQHNDNLPRGSSLPTANMMNSAFVNEVLLNVMVSGPISGAAAA
jgi:hypothetical protein